MRASRTRVRTTGYACIAIAAMVGTAAVTAASRRADACATAPSPTRVTGVVVDREGPGVAGAFVVPERAGVSTLADPLDSGVTTDRDGRFEIVGLPPGDYAFVSVRAGAIGATPEMPVIDRLVVTISIAGATRT